MPYAVGTRVDFKKGLRASWQTGVVEEVGFHAYKIRSEAGSLCTLTLGGKGRSGSVRASQEDAPVTASLPTPAALALRVVRTGGTLTAQPRPREPYRCPVYLAYVRSQPCCSCGAPGPSDPHHSGLRGVGQKADDYSCVPLCRPCHERVTDTYALPGLTREETAMRLLQVQVALLTEWAAGADALVAEHITVPILSRSAS